MKRKLYTVKEGYQDTGPDPLRSINEAGEWRRRKEKILDQSSPKFCRKKKPAKHTQYSTGPKSRDILQVTFL